MKKISFFILVLSFAFVSCTDNSAVNHAFVKYGHREGVTSISVPGFVVHFAARIGDLDKDERELLRSIDKVKVLTVEDSYLNEDIDLHAEFYENMNKNGEYEELLNVREDGENVTIFGIMEDSDKIREIIVLVGGDENTLVYLKGNFRASMLNKYVASNREHGDLLSFDF